MSLSISSVTQTEPVEFNEEIKRWINERLVELIVMPYAGCLEFPVFFTRSLRNYVLHQAISLGLRSLTYRENGIKHIKVFKGVDDKSPRISLASLSRKVIFHYLKKVVNTPDGPSENYQVTSIVPTHKLCTWKMNKNGCSPLPSNRGHCADQLIWISCSIHVPRNRLIDTISHCQLTILHSHSMEGRIYEIPQCLLEEFARSGCRVICSLGHKLSTMYYSEFLSSKRGERLGLSVGYQIQLESKSSISNNLLYTTHRFFLRCLFENRRETFAETTHIIVDDISEADIYGEMLLKELRQAMHLYPHLKVILMCDKEEADSLRSYFSNGHLLDLETPLKHTNISFLEAIQRSIYSNSPQAILIVPIMHSQEAIDILIAKCFEHGRKEDFDTAFEYQRDGLVDLNVQHSLTQTSFSMAASRHDRVEYLATFIQLGGDLSLVDFTHKSALDWALVYGNVRCVQLLRENLLCRNIRKDYSNSAISWQDDHRNLICSLLKTIESSGKPGSVLILLPSFDEMIKQERLLKQKFLARAASDSIEICLLHEYMEMDDYANLWKDSNQRKVILTTDMPISTLTLKDVAFIIDSGRRVQQTDSCNTLFSWISKNCALKRSQLITSTGEGFCYRLYSKSQFELFQDTIEPDLNAATLGHVCLHAKLLAPSMSLRNYFDETRIHLGDAVLNNIISVLQANGIMDDNESITTLGMRIVDIPIDIQLAKVVIFGVVLQCLDPVLTIASMLSFYQPMQFLQESGIEDDANNQSDLLTLLRVYQRWSDESPCNDSSLTENAYISNAKLEVISLIRAQLIGILRAITLIQSNGLLNIHFVNQYANNWPLVKAAFVAGMYENICQWNPTNRQLMGKFNSPIELNTDSVLLNDKHRLYQQNLILYHSTKISETDKTLAVFNTIISTATAVLFSSICAPNATEYNPLFYDDDNDSDSEGSSYGINDEVQCYYISKGFLVGTLRQDTCLLFELRRKFLNFFNNVILHFNTPEGFRKTQNIFMEKSELFVTLAYLLQLEDEACQLAEPKRIGERPNIYTSKFKKNQDKSVNPTMTNLNKKPNDNTLTESYFIIKVEPNSKTGNLISDRCNKAWCQLIAECKEQSPVVIFVHVAAGSVFRGAIKLCLVDNKYIQEEISSRNVPVEELNAIYFMNGIDPIPNLFDGQQLNTTIGSQFLKLFI